MLPRTCRREPAEHTTGMLLIAADRASRNQGIDKDIHTWENSGANWTICRMVMLFFMAKGIRRILALETR